MKNSRSVFLGLAVLLLTAGCSTKTQEPSADQTGVTEDAKSKSPDVSIQHCVDDGYEVVQVSRNGIPANHLCINPKTNLKCDSWAYYRGDCQLDAGGSKQNPDQGKAVQQN
jgi:putative hemolysin